MAGHQEIGETDKVCAIRETVEETGLLLESTRLCRVYESHRLVKQGSPGIRKDRHESEIRYLYRTNKVNNERASLFVVRVAEGEELQPMDVGSGQTRFEWLSLDEAVDQAKQHPDRFASSFKHLLSDGISAGLQRSMLQSRTLE